MKNKKSIPAKTKKLIFQEANSTCPFCGVSDVGVLEIHHINDPFDNSPGNLILACANCHSKITNGDIEQTTVKERKADIQKGTKHFKASSALPSNVIQLGRSLNTGIIANVLTIKTPRKSSVKLQYPHGAIGTDLFKRNYIKYLIDRYHKFKAEDIKRSGAKMNYSIIYTAIKTEFKCPWNFVPLEKFSDLASYLQRRIDGTILGKYQRSKGIRNYQTIEEYRETMNLQGRRA